MSSPIRTRLSPTLFWLGVLSVAACRAPAPTAITQDAVGGVELHGAQGLRAFLTTTDSRALRLQPDSINWVANVVAPDPRRTVEVDRSQRYQVMDGFGFTLTGGSAQHLSGMSLQARRALLRELFGSGPGEMHFSYLRLSVGASDLDERPFSYHDPVPAAGDTSLARFSLGHDTLYLLPILREIVALQPGIKLMASPWSPPTWMKDNGDTRGGSLLPEYERLYARYLLRYLEAMAAEGFRIDALTVQNEPLHPGNNPSLLMLPDQQARFVGQHLGPVLEAAGVQTKIVVYDHNADRPDYPITVFQDPAARRYAEGSAFHLYGGSIEALSQVHGAFPDKSIYFTEQWVGAPGDFAGDFGWHLQNLTIGAPNHWAKTVLEWNLSSNATLTPHTDRGGCDRCLGAVTIVGDEVTRNPAYYSIGQASRFVPPGAVRIGSRASGDLASVAFETPARRIVVIVQNLGSETEEIDIVEGARRARYSLPAKAAVTVVME